MNTLDLDRFIADHLTSTPAIVCGVVVVGLLVIGVGTWLHARLREQADGRDEDLRAGLATATVVIGLTMLILTLLAGDRPAPPTAPAPSTTPSAIVETLPPGLGG